MPDTMVNETVADRVRKLRGVLGHENQASMASFLGVDFNRYNNVERGKPLGHELAVRICQKVPGVTLDWLYFGKMDGLPFELARRIGEAPAASGRPSKATKRPR